MLGKEFLLRDPLKGGVSRGAFAHEGLGAHVQSENVRHHDHSVRAVAILEHGVFQRFSTVDKETAAPVTLILDDPVAVTVSADQEQRGFRRTRRGRFMLVHDTFLSNGSWVKSADDWEIVVVFRRHVVAPAKQLSLDPAPGPGCFNEQVAQDREKISDLAAALRKRNQQEWVTAIMGCFDIVPPMC